MKKVGLLIILILTIFATLIYAKDIYKVVKDKCVGCYICLKSCPVNAIKKEGRKVVIDATKCIGCGLCVKVCPTKAIVKETIPEQQNIAAKTVTAVAGKAQVVAQSFKETYKVVKEKCVSCFICIEKCPVKAIKKENGKVVIDTTKCIACGICANVCPTKAIEKVKIPVTAATSNSLQSAKIDTLQKNVTPIVTTKPKTVIKSKEIKEEVVSTEISQPVEKIDKSLNESIKTNVAVDEDEKKEKYISREELKRELRQEILEELAKEQEQTERIASISVVKNEEVVSQEINEKKAEEPEAVQENEVVAFIKKVLRISKTACVTCKKCDAICPVNAIEIRNNKAIIDQTKCIGCMKCISACNYKAIYVVKGGK